MSKAHCSFPGCGRKAYCKGLCVGHYIQRSKRKALTELIIRRKSNTQPVISVDIVACHNKSLEGPCHVWNRYISPGGYGAVSVNGKMQQVHRYVWSLTHGKIPEGLVLDHQCRNRACCNVNHLRLVTPTINTLENSNGVAAMHKAKTHCKHGHPFDETNTRIRKDGNRDCRACIKIRNDSRRVTSVQLNSK